VLNIIHFVIVLEQIKTLVGRLARELRDYTIVRREHLRNKVNKSVKTIKNMKQYTAIIAAVAAIGLWSNAKADDIITIPGTVGSYSITVDSSWTFAAGEYTYSYQITPNNGATYDEASIYFNTGLAAIFNETGTAQGGSTLTPTMPTPPYDANYHWSAEQTGVESVSFESPIGPTTGYFGAQDNTTYPETWGVFVPHVPDGGLTLSLLGGSLLALQVCRRKLLS
jgi:hypothetical protein